MEQPQKQDDAAIPAVPAAPDIQTQSKKRNRTDSEVPAPTDASSQANFPSALTPLPQPIRETSPQSDAKESSDAVERPSSLPDNALPESFSPSTSAPRLSTGARGSLSPPYMFSAPPTSQDPPVGTTDGSRNDDGEDGTDQDELEEHAALEQAEEGSIVIDNDDLGTDDGYGTDSNTTASTSLAESMRDYMYENGRRYHKFREGRYNFPNDDVECVTRQSTHSGGTC